MRLAILTALFLLLPAWVSAQIATVQSGHWNNPSTWGGRVPGPTDTDIRIRPGHRVDFYGVDAVVGCNVIVEAGAFFYTDPLQPSSLTFALDQTKVTAFVGGGMFQPTDCGFWRFGHADLIGQPFARTWSRMVTGADVGDTQFLVDGDLGDWPIGGLIVLGQTRPSFQWRIAFSYNPPRQVGDPIIDTETCRIAAIEVLGEGDETLVTCAAPLTKPHQALYDGLNRAGVGLLTRSLTFTTDLAGSNVNDSRQRKYAHVRFMPGSTGRIAYVGLKQMGAYGVTGMYALHIHMLGDGSRGLNVLGLSCISTGFRCTNVHSSNGVKVEDSVAYDTGGGAAHFVQVDNPATIADVAFVHNAVFGLRSKPFVDRSSSVPGEYGRAASCFWPGATTSESYLGNLCQGTNEGLTTGAHWPEIATSQAGTLPHTYLLNEFNGLTAAVLFSWQNRDLERDLVDTRIFGSPVGFQHGAYSDALRQYRSTYWGNPIGMVQHVDNGFAQDSLFHGSDVDADRLLTPDQSILTAGHSLQPQPFHPSRYRRNTFERLGPSYLLSPGVAITLDTTTCADPTQEAKALSGQCNIDLIELSGNTYGPGLRPFKFGAATNLNTFWLDHDTQRVLLRADQMQPRGEFPPSLVTSASTYDVAADALATPFSSLPASITFGSLTSYRGRPYGPFTLTVATDDPPAAPVLSIQRIGTQLSITADVSPDTTTLEFIVNERPVVTLTAAPWTALIDLADLPADWWGRRRYAYVIARAFDGVCIDGGLGEGGFVHPCYQQRAYSAGLEFGPEVLWPMVSPPPPADQTVERLLAEVARLTAVVASTEAEREAIRAELVTMSAQVAGLVGERDTWLARVRVLEAAILAAQAALNVAP